jgi:predicted GNAT superfamily acetyltransferase
LPAGNGGLEFVKSFAGTTVVDSDSPNAGSGTEKRMTFAISDIRDHLSVLDSLLRLNNENARETSLLTREKLDNMVAAASVATAIAPGTAFLLAFGRDDSFDGGHFRWFRERLDSFLYVDRIVVGHGHRRLGLGRLLYEDLFRRAEPLGHSHIACEVNVQPPNPTSDAFHASLGFTEIGTATIDGGAKTVRYLVRHQ